MASGFFALLDDIAALMDDVAAMTKVDGVEVLVSEAVLTAAGIPTDSLDIRSLTLRGVTQPVPALALRRATELAALLSPEPGQTRPIEAV